MSLAFARVVVGALELYALAGFVFAVVFLAAAVTRVDPGVAASPKSLRLLLLPGVAAMWPLFASRWIGGTMTPVERNPHRDAAARIDAVAR